MSYARFGSEGSDVYVYLDCDGYLTCCGCWLREPVRAKTTADMLTHLGKHLAAGHVVPRSTIAALEADAEQNDAWIVHANQDCECGHKNHEHGHHFGCRSCACKSDGEPAGTTEGAEAPRGET